jgi:hypothetical protein
MIYERIVMSHRPSLPGPIRSALRGGACLLLRSGEGCLEGGRSISTRGLRFYFGRAAEASAQLSPWVPPAPSGGFVIGDDGVLLVESMIDRQLFRRSSARWTRRSARA